MSDIIERAEKALTYYHCHPTVGVIGATSLLAELLAELKAARAENERASMMRHRLSASSARRFATALLAAADAAEQAAR